MKKKLTQAQRRVAVAKDALKQVESEKLIAKAGTYCQFISEVPEIASESSAKFQKFLKGKGSECQACARGALFISTVRKENAFIPDANFLDIYKSVGRSDFDPRLERLFSKAQLDDIETAFESPDTPEYYEADDHDRLVLILKNIIKNRGTFVKPTGE